MELATERRALLKEGAKVAEKIRANDAAWEEYTQQLEKAINGFKKPL